MQTSMDGGYMKSRQCAGHAFLATRAESGWAIPA